MKSAKSKTTDSSFLTKFKTKVLDLSLNLDLSPFVKSAPDGRAGGWQEKVCAGCISETVRCRTLLPGRDIGLGYISETKRCRKWGHWLGSVGVQRHGVTLI